jgi:hypothetical protein
LNLSHPFSLSEIEEGEFNENQAILETTSIIRGSNAKDP